MSTAYGNRRHTTTGSLALALRQLAEKLDRTQLEISPSMLIVSIQVQKQEDRERFAEVTVQDLHGRLHPGEAMPEYDVDRELYLTPFSVSSRESATWVTVYGKMPAPARIVAEAEAAERAEVEAAAARIIELEVSTDLDRSKPLLAAAFMTPDVGGDVWDAPTMHLPVVTA